MMTNTPEVLVGAGATLLAVGLTAYWTCCQRKRGSVGPTQPCPTAQPAAAPPASIFDGNPTLIDKKSADGRITVSHLEGKPYMARKVTVPPDMALPRGFSRNQQGEIEISEDLKRKIESTDDCRKVAAFTSEEIHESLIFFSDARNAMLVTKPDAKGGEVNIFNIQDTLDRGQRSPGLEPGADQQKLGALEPGDVLCIVSGGNVINGKDDETWKYHYGTVIAISGNDYLTFENYRYNGEQNWYFGLYGQGTESFHGVFANTHEYGSQPRTHRFKQEKRSPLKK